MKPNERDELIDALIEGDITEADFIRLEAEMLVDPLARKAYLDRVALTQALMAEAGIASATTAAPTVKPQRLWLTWRPLTAAAAGLVFGLFSATMVFAYAVPGMLTDRHRVVSLFRDGFEDAKADFGRGFPRDAGGWSGDSLEVIEADDERSPKEGLHMVRLAPVKERKFCAAVRIMDLAEFPPGSETESITVEVTASFHGMESEWQDRNQIRLAAFAEPPADVRHIWRTDGSLEQALLHVARTIETKPGDRGWQTLHASMVIPAGTRSLVIHLGASIADDSAPKSAHFLDDVQVRFTAHEVPLQ